MDVARPISAVVPTLDGPVLQVLARTHQPLTGRDVHRLSATGSEAGVRKVLTRLADHGLVHVSEAGRALLYVANRDHLAWPAVKRLVALRAELIERLRAEFDSWRIPPVAAALFGSAARGDGGTTSDIDLLVIRQEGHHDNESTWVDQLDDLRDHVAAWTGNNCQIYDIDEGGLCEHVSASEAIVAEWRADAVTVHGESIAHLLAGTGYGAHR